MIIQITHAVSSGTAPGHENNWTKNVPCLAQPGTQCNTLKPVRSVGLRSWLLITLSIHPAEKKRQVITSSANILETGHECHTTCWTQYFQCIGSPQRMLKWPVKWQWKNYQLYQGHSPEHAQPQSSQRMSLWVRFFRLHSTSEITHPFWDANSPPPSSSRDDLTDVSVK